MPSKLTYKEAQQRVEVKGYILISDIYEGYYVPLIIQDYEGYLYRASLSKLSNEIPTKFHSNNPYTIHNIKLWCKLNDKPFELLSDTYINAKELLRWKCLKESCNEIFEVCWGNILSGCGCPFCAGRQVGLSNCLATKRPDLIAEWHPTLNGYLTPWNVTANSDTFETWWQCSKNPEHEWHTSIYNRNTRNSGCPYCAGQKATKDNNLLICNPKLCEEWDYSKNIMKPEEYCPNSSNSVHWECEKGHKWEATIGSRNDGRGCPYCAGYLPSEDNNLLIYFPDVCKDWDYNKNDKLPSEYTPHASFEVWWKCKDCGHEWFIRIANRTSGGSGCPECNKSKGEKEISKILSNNYINNYPHHIFPDCRYINPLEFDFYLPNHIVAIEYQGIQHYEPVDFAGKGEEWALEQFKGVQIRDQIKRDYCKINNIKLIEVPYWDFDNIEEILIGELMINNE